MRRSFEGKRHQPAKSEEKRKRCDRKHRGFGFFCAFLLCAGLISGGAAVSGESGAQEAVNAEAPADDAVQPEVPAQPVEEAQQNTPAPEDTEGGGEAGQQQEETPDQQQEELYPEDDGNGEESVPSVSRPDAGSAESSAAPVGTTAEPLTVSVTTAMKYAFAGENALTFETQITGGTEPFETSCEIDRDGTPVWSSQEYQPEVTYMPEEAGGYELVLSVTDAAGQAASGRCAIPVAVRHEESPSDWEPALKEVRMTGRYAEDLLAIARTQLGYTESADNFIVTEEGARQGYTRYGQWQGDAYEPWDAAFAAFCLYYAGVRDVPADTKAEKWADELKRRGMYRDLTAENRPEEGDFLFTRDGEVTRIGLVEKTDDTGVTAIEGDVGGAVARVTYGWDDARLAGFGDPRTTLTDEAAGVTVTGIFPEGATLTVQLLAEDADGFTEAQDRIHAALSPLYDRYAVNLADVTETAVYVPSLTVNGEVVSPCKKVRVGVSACGGRFAGHGDVRVLTFSDEQTELLSAEEKDGGDGADAIVSASFRTDRLSEFALTAVAPDRLTMRRTAADGDAKVTVTYGAGAGVPESAELRVRQIRGDGDDADRAEYQKRQAEAAALLETEAGGENAASQPDTAASGSPGNAENADVSRQTDQNAENAAADQQADQNAENVAADQTEDSKEYAAYMEEVEAALASGRKVQMAKLFDITILDKEGNEVEPLTPVRANIEFVPKEVQEGTDLELYQFQTEGEKPQVMENVEVLTDDDNIVNGIEFETDGFSVYGITVEHIDHKGTKYEVTVTYGPEAKIPEGSTLRVTDIEDGTQAYDDARNAVLADKKEKNEFVDIDDFNLAALDISIIDPNGKEIEPEAAVTVGIKIKDLPGVENLDEIKESLEIQHHVEVTDGVVIEKVFDGSVEGSYEMDTDENIAKVGTIVDPSSVSDEDFRDLNNEGDETSLDVTFETEDFSTFTITWGSRYGRRTTTIHYGYMENGRFVEFTDAVTETTYSTSYYDYLVRDFDGYVYSGNSYYRTSTSNTPATGGTPIQALLRYSNNHWRYHDYSTTWHDSNWNEMANNSHVYVLYNKSTIQDGGKPKTKPVNPGEEPDEPTILKESKPNGDGTADLSLSIRGSTVDQEVEKLADVIVVFDVSGSMAYNMSGGSSTSWTNPSRLNIAINAVNNLVDTLAEKKDSAGNPLIRMSLITFSTNAQQEIGLTDLTDAGVRNYKATVSGLSADGGTNWEKALRLANETAIDSERATFVIFVSDGDPTYRESRQGAEDREIQGYDRRANYLLYNVIGAGNSDPNNRNYNAALDVAKNIVQHKKNFYTIGISNDVTNMASLNSSAGGQGNYTATSSAQLEQAFDDIATSIQAMMGAGDIHMTDGITDMTNTVEKSGLVGVSGDFTYWKAPAPANWNTMTAEQKAAYKPADSAFVEWDPSSERCEEAEYDEASGSVKWDMGSNFVPQNGCTYKVTFNVWPTQEAYDILAKCKNDPNYYDTLSDAQKDQIIKSGNTYSLKTNDKKPNTTYKDATKSGDTVTTTGDAKTLYFNEVDPLGLAEDRVSVQKTWNNQVDSTQPHDITLKLYGDENGTKTLYKTFTLTADNNWIASDGYISCGLMTVDESTGKVVIYESGHDFTLEETGEGSYYWDLKADTYHPMVINNQRTTLALVEGDDIPAGMGSSDYYNASGTKYYRIGNSVYKYVGDASDGISLTARNDHRTYVDLSKIVTGVENSTEEFAFKITLNDSLGVNNGNDGYLFFTVRNNNVSPAVYLDDTSVNTTAEYFGIISGRPYFRVYTGTEFTLNIRQGWGVRFLNLPGESSYTIVEQDKTNYEFVSISASAMIGGESTPIDVTITEAEKKIEGTVDQSNAGHTIQYTNRAITRQVTLLKTTEAGKGSPLGGAQFDLYTKAGYESNPKQAPIKTGIESSTTEASKGLMDLGTLAVGDYYLVETKAPDGYNLLDAAIALHVEQDKISIIQGGSQRQDITPDDTEYDAFITNTSGVELPHTGGPGTLPYTLGGIALIMASALMYGFRMRRRERRLN